MLDADISFKDVKIDDDAGGISVLRICWRGQSDKFIFSHLYVAEIDFDFSHILVQ